VERQGAEKDPKIAETKAVLEFNRQLGASPDFVTTILPIRDGVAGGVQDVIPMAALRRFVAG